MLAVIDGRYLERFETPLARLGVAAAASARCDMLEAPAAYHPDMVLFQTGPDSAICAPDMYDTYNAFLGEKGIKIVQGAARLASNYPSCAAYNVAWAGKVALHRLGATDPAVAAFLEGHGVKLLPVGQGYARCSACIADGRAVITADTGISTAAAGAGLSVLRIRPGHVGLPGYPYGFIGGASGWLPGTGLVFAGDLAHHPDGGRIRAFCAAQDIPVVCLDGGPLADVGTILFFDV